MPQVHRRSRKCNAATVSNDSDGLGIRQAHPSEFQVLRDLEEASDLLFADVGIGPFSPDIDHLGTASLVLVSGNPPVGFVSLEIVDGAAHIWQLSVHPSAGRHGRGTALVMAACEWAAGEGYDAVTLTTFRDVSWNGPYYAKLRSEIVETLSPGLSAIREREMALGDDVFGPR